MNDKQESAKTVASRVGSLCRLQCLAILVLASLGCPTSGFVYVANQGSNNVSAYIIDSASGAPSVVVGSPFPAGQSPQSVAADPTGRFAYVANQGLNGNPGDVSAYTINGGTGALTPVPGSPFPAGQGPHSVAVDPTGRFAYVASNSGIFAYTIDGGTGALITVPGPPFTGTPQSLAMDPKGRFVYVTGNESPEVSFINAYSIDGTTGALTNVPGSPFPGCCFDVGAAVDPTGRFVYVTTNFGPGAFANFINAYSIDGTTGALTNVPGSPFPVETVGPVTVHPAGRFLYTTGNTTDFGAGSIAAYTIDSTTGALTAIPGYVFRTWGIPSAITVHPTGRFLYTANQVSNSVNAYTIDSTGALRVVLGLPYWLPFPAGSSPSGITSTAGLAPPPPAAFVNERVDVAKMRKSSGSDATGMLAITKSALNLSERIFNHQVALSIR